MICYLRGKVRTSGDRGEYSIPQRKYMLRIDRYLSKDFYIDGLCSYLKRNIRHLLKKTCQLRGMIRYLKGKIHQREAKYVTSETCYSRDTNRYFFGKICYLGGKIPHLWWNFYYLRGMTRFLRGKFRYLCGKIHYLRGSIRYLCGKVQKE